ncbi:MAG TPA: DUF2853 family protein [Casimicrobiaceae bacterium]|nr:DUF2853 family protein [Casimicrobiaceae bacterium]
MSDHATDIAKFTSNVNADAVKAIVNYCGIALQSRDGSMVSATDPKELATIRDGFAAKKLGLAPDAADAAIKSVAEKMKGEHHKSRVTFYYLLAESTGTLARLGK